MSVLLIGLSIISAFLALTFEYVIARKEHSTRALIEQPLVGLKRAWKGLYRSLFITALLSLLFGLILAGSHRQWTNPVQGVAIVLDTSTLSPNPSDALSLEKSAAIELIRSLPGVTFSLYELKGGAIQSVVPPTIDRLYFELQLDGLLPSLPHGTPVTLASVQDSVLRHVPGIPPWIIYVGSSEIAKGKELLDAVATIVIEGHTVSCSVIEQGVSLRASTIERIGEIIIQRLNRSPIPTAPDATETFLLVLCSLLALVSFVFWRKAVPPMGALTIALALSSQLCGLTEPATNNIVQQAIDVAQASDFSESQRLIESLLTTTTEPKARHRLFYDRALLAYLQGRDIETIQWLDMEPTPEQQPSLPQTLRGLALTRLALSGTDDREEQRRKAALRDWVQGHPPVDQRVLAAATLALISPATQRSDEESVRQSLLWLDECTQDSGKKEFSLTASLLTKPMNDHIERQFAESWPETIAHRFSKEVVGQKSSTVSSLRIWYDLAGAQTPIEGITVLLNQASMSANSILYFPGPTATEDLTLATSLITDLLPSLPNEQKRPLQFILTAPSGEGIQQGASWYARAALWPALRTDPRAIKPLVLVLNNEIDAATSPLVKRTLASLISSLYPFCKDGEPLEVILEQALSSWYAQDPTDALDTVLKFANSLPHQWGPRLMALITPPIQQMDQNAPSVAGAMAKGLNNAMSDADPLLTGRLWQIALSSTGTPQEVLRYVDHLILLTSELLSRLNAPTDPEIRSLVLMYAVQPLILSQLQHADIFQKKLPKRAIYDQLLSDWNKSCLSVQLRIAEPSTFRLPKVREEVTQSLDILHRLRDLLRETESAPKEQPQRTPPSAGAGVPFSLRGEDAVRLFQEMDRSDRAL